jgi:hypothetical protein
MKLAKMAMMLPLLALVPSVAEAGAKCAYSVSVNPVGRYASGAMSSARNSADTLSYLACTAYAWGYAFCVARNSAGTVSSCGTSDPAYVNMLQTLNPDSYVYFAWDEAGTCTSLVIENVSCLEPKSH